MEPVKAREVIKKYNLINKKKSKEIINFIKDKKKKLSFSLNKYDLNKIEKIRKEYDSILKKNNKYAPRNLPIYKIIKKNYENFSWKKINEHYDINFNSEYINQRVTLASLLLRKIKKKTSNKNIKNKNDVLINKFLNSDIFVKIDTENKKLFLKLIKSLNKNDE